VNHTDRIIHVTRQIRGVTREHARQVVELYLASVAEEVASGELVSLPSIGKLRLTVRPNTGRIVVDINGDHTQLREPGYRVQTSLRLNESLKQQCRKRFIADNPGPTRITPATKEHYPGSARIESGQSDYEIDE